MSLSEEDSLANISAATTFVLYTLGGFFTALALLVTYKLLGRAFGGKRPQRRQKDVAANRPAAGAPQDAPVSAASPRDVVKPSKPSVSLKQLVKSSQRSSRQAAPDKPVEHALYLNSLKGFYAATTGVCFSPDGSKVAVACKDKILRIFLLEDVINQAITCKKKTLQREVIDVAFGAAEDVFVLTEGETEVSILEKYKLGAKGEALMLEWELKGIHGLEEGKGLSGGLALNGQSLVVSFSSGSDVKVFNGRGTQLASVNSAGLQNHGAAMTRDGRFFGAATFTSDVKIYEVQFSREGDLKGVPKVMDLKKAHNGQIFCLDFSLESSRAVTASKDGTWAVWNLDVRYKEGEDPKIILKAKQETGSHRYKLISFGPDGIIAAVYDSALHFLDGNCSGNLLEVVEKAHDAQITALQWSPCLYNLGSRKTAVLATSSSDRRVRLWRAPIV